MSLAFKRGVLGCFFALWLLIGGDAALEAFAPGASLDAFTAVVLVAVPVLLVVNVRVAVRERSRERELVFSLLAQRRMLEAFTAAGRSGRRWPGEPWFDVQRALTALVLWRLPDAEAALRSARSTVIDREAEHHVLALSVVAAELAGSGDDARRRASRWQVPAAPLGTADLVRAARASDWPAVETVLASGATTDASFAPLHAAIDVWASQSQAPVDVVTLLGETGVPQVARVWPEFAAFLTRASEG